ncbi:hypothetical protein M422DRAFT_270194 [Sphaerobolus stellatus SS14]|uniref:Extracellular membrane protein CFEM domain-containing protein n=1 Tax=Sphaerobolus stellatus (strain SS14) TaxID=990650 RepID=A0A0C9TGF5_SPHS4|nr:hypothetical protein M422DRAFT_270194 [Sphaerobolus stellatus SS14]
MRVQSIIVATLSSALLVSATSSSFVTSVFARADTVSDVDVPAACKSQCQPYVNLVNRCDPTKVTVNQTLDCFCNDSAAKTIESCFGCAVTQNVTQEERQQAQSALDSLSNTCKQAGRPFSSPLTLDSGAVAVMVAQGTALMAVVLGLFALL